MRLDTAPALRATNPAVTFSPLRTVADLMTDTVIVLQHDEAVGDSTDDMDRFRLRHLPVMNGDRVVGIVTHRELLRAVLATEVMRYWEFEMAWEMLDARAP